MPGKLGQNPAVRRIESNQPCARQKQCISFTSKSRHDWRRVTRFIVASFPEELPSHLIQSHYPGALRSSDANQHGVAFNQRRTSQTKKSFTRLVLALQVRAPEFLAGRKF